MNGNALKWMPINTLNVQDLKIFAKHKYNNFIGKEKGVNLGNFPDKS
jgi:hypothetical protein